MYFSINAVGKLLERQCALQGSDQPVLWAAHQVFHYLSDPEKSGILQVDVFSKVFQQLPSPPRDNTNLEATAASPDKPCLSPHMAVQWCSHISGWASAPLECLTGQVGLETGTPSAYHPVCCSLEMKAPPKQALLLTSLSSCATRPAGTISQSLYCLPPVRAKKMHHNRGPFVLHFATSTDGLDQNQKKQISWKNTAKSTALYKGSLNSPTPRLWEIWYGFNWCSSFSQGFLPCLLDTFIICHHKYFQLLQMMPQGTGWW